MKANRNIFLVDDDATVCQALSVFLQASGYHVRAYHSAESFLEETDYTAEGIILLDIRMTGISGLELQTELARRGINLPIIFLTGHADIQMSVMAIKAGAVNFLEKPISNETLLASIGEAFSRLDDSKMCRHAAIVINDRYATLTKREREVMQHVVTGMQNKDIAELLGLSNRTIETHRHNLMKKMGAESLVDLMRQYAMCRSGAQL